MSKKLVIIPTYNEANNLPVLVAEIWALQIPDLTILVVDDNSPDGTGMIADELANQRAGEITVLHQPQKTGLRHAYIAAIKWGLACDTDIIIQMDCDFSHAPKHIPEMLGLIPQADLVLGSRFISGGKLDERMGAGRYLLSWWANTVYARSILNLKTHDATSGYRCWRASALARVDLDTIKSNGYTFQIEMIYVAEKMGLKILEIPIFFEDRRLGRSKLALAEKIDAAFRTWQLRWRYRHFSISEQQDSVSILKDDVRDDKELNHKDS